MYVDLRNFLSSKNVPENIIVRTRPSEDETDEYGMPKDLDSEPITIQGVIVEKVQTGYDVKTGTFLEKVTYKIYLDRKKYGNVDFAGAEIRFRDREFMGVSYPLVRPYASHFTITATERKVRLNGTL